MAGLLAAPQQGGTPDESKRLMAHSQKIVYAARNLLYKGESGDKFMARMQQMLKTKSPAEVAATAASEVILMLANASGGKMSPKATVPAGVMLVADIMDFMAKALKQKLDPAAIEKATMLFCQRMLKIAQQMGGGNAKLG